MNLTISVGKINIKQDGWRCGNIGRGSCIYGDEDVDRCKGRYENGRQKTVGHRKGGIEKG